MIGLGLGKSTLLRCVNLLEPPEEGRILLEGKEITGKDAVEGIDFVRRRVGMVFQQFNLFPHKSALENVCIAQEKVSTAAAPRRGRRPRPCSPALGWPTRSASTRTGSRADSSSGWRSPALAMDPRVMLRRGHLGTRPGAGQGGARRDARARRGGDDDDRRDPRDGLRPRGREPGRVHGRGRGRRGGPPPRCSATRSRSARSGSSGWCWSIQTGASTTSNARMTHGYRRVINDLGAGGLGARAERGRARRHATALGGPARGRPRRLRPLARRELPLRARLCSSTGPATAP